MSKFKISFCTTCMNRLIHLKQTLKQNILDNENYPDLEFILLDYNSSDGLQEYVETELDYFIKNKKLIYFRTEEPVKYNMSHSRNLAFKLATGEIVCNIDADNFTGIGFASFVNDMFQDDDKIFLCTHDKVAVKNDVLGRICVKKVDFLSISGYDETMKHYGFDDHDFCNRLEMFGLKKKTINDIKFLNAISHDNAVRMSNFNTSELEILFIKHLSPAMSNLYFLFKNGECVSGTIVNNLVYNALNLDSPKKSLKFRYSILEKNWLFGSWERIDNEIKLLSAGKQTTLLKKKENLFLSEGINNFIVVTSKHLMEEMLFFYHQLSNRLIMEKNLLSGNFIVNNGIFGEGKVIKNL